MRKIRYQISRRSKVGVNEDGWKGWMEVGGGEEGQKGEEKGIGLLS